jgi:hypothetical protein
MIIESYANGIPPSSISAVIGKTEGSIKIFYSPRKLNLTLPPKEKRSRTKIIELLLAVIEAGGG